MIQTFILDYFKSKVFRIKVFMFTVVLIAFVHLVLKPFQLAVYATTDFVFVNIAYFIITSVVLYSYLILIPDKWAKFEIFIAKKWGLHKFIFSMIFSMGLLMFCFKVVFGFYSVSLARLGTGLLAVSAFGLIPILFIVVFNKKKEKKERLQSIVVKGKTIFPEQLIAVQSDKNYVIWIVEEAGVMIKIRERNTIKQVMAQLSFLQNIKQSHRAYLVNIDFVGHVVSKNNAYEIHCSNDLKIPLSRGFRSNF